MQRENSQPDLPTCWCHDCLKARGFLPHEAALATRIHVSSLCKSVKLELVQQTIGNGLIFQVGKLWQVSQVTNVLWQHIKKCKKLIPESEDGKTDRLTQIWNWTKSMLSGNISLQTTHFISQKNELSSRQISVRLVSRYPIACWKVTKKRCLLVIRGLRSWNLCWLTSGRWGMGKAPQFFLLFVYVYLCWFSIHHPIHSNSRFSHLVFTIQF